MPEFTSDWFSARIPQWQELLAEYIGKPNLRFVEIGSYEGRSAIWTLVNVLTEPTALLTCIDPWRDAEIERRFDRNNVETGRSNQVRKVKGISATTLPGMRAESADFVYVDGSHEARDTLLDGLLGWRLLKIGGLLIFDDYGWDDPRRHHPPKLGIDAFLSINDWCAEVVHRGYQVAVLKNAA
jgi:predicted O-methyltransferase YrrM